MVAASPQYGFASCKPKGDVSVDLLVASAQGMSMCICQLQVHRGCQCGFASCKPTGDVSVDLVVASPQGMSVWIC